MASSPWKLPKKSKPDPTSQQELQEEVTAAIEAQTEAIAVEQAKGPSEVKADQTMQLYYDYLSAKDNMQAAPQEYADALKAFLLSRDGPGGVAAAYDRQAAAMKASYQADFNALIAEATTAAGLYKTVSTYALNAQTMLVDQLGNYSDDLTEVSLLAAEKNTAERKSYYLNQVNSSTESWDGYLTVYITALGFVYAKHVLYEKQQYRSIPAWTGLLLIWMSSYLLPKIVGGIASIKPAVNIYTTWVRPNPVWTGSAVEYDPDAAKTGTIVP
jgi:hypothetical protein